MEGKSMQYYSAMTLLACLGVLILVVQAATNNALSRRIKLDVIFSSLMIIVAAACEYLGVRLDGADPSLRGLHMAVKFLELSLAPAIPVVFGAGVYPVKKPRWLAIPLLAHMALEFASMFLGITYYVDAANVYSHCSFYALYYAAYIMGVVFMLERVTRFIRSYQNQSWLSLLCIMLYVLFGVLWQAVSTSMRVVWLSVCFGVILFYNYYCELLQQTDPLTGLLNRRNFENRMGRKRGRGVLLIADVNDFKSVNDCYGHPYGDVCLAAVGGMLKEVYGKYGRCYRIGGDEFAVVLDRMPESVEALNAALETQVTARQRVEVSFPGVSVGYAEFDLSCLTLTEAMDRADQMMYERKGYRKRR